MSSPNDVTAKVFDIVYGLKQKTERQLNFVTSILGEGDPILDVGCGTGRHLIPLLKMGYEVVGIDNSKEMLRVLTEKLQANNLQAEIKCQDILRTKHFNGRFGAAICFWNAFSEIAKTCDEATACLKLLLDSLQKNGKAIIHQNAPILHNPTSFSSRSVTRRDGMVYKTINEIVDVDVEGRISILREVVEIERNEKSVETLETHIVQKWWTKSELEVLCEEAGFSGLEFFGLDFLPLKHPTGTFILVATK